MADTPDSVDLMESDSPPRGPHRPQDRDEDASEGEAEWAPGADEGDDDGGSDDDAGDGETGESEELSESEEDEEEDEAGDEDLMVLDSDGEAIEQRPKKRKRKAKDESERGDRARKRNRNRRKQLAEIITDENLDESTRKAREAERARAGRLDLNLSEDQLAAGEDGGVPRVCLNANVDGTLPTGKEGTDDAPVFVHPDITGKLKKHQIVGARFMWSHIAVEPNGFGCVLADFMGLGKTLQVITVVQAFLSAKKLDEDGYLMPRHKHVLILAPTICVRNWEAEVVKWLGKKEARRLGLQTLESSREKKMTDRVHVVKQWHKRGGILIMGYELYRLLVLQSSGDEKIAAGNAKHTNLIKQVYALLSNPGPDLIVLDEGHRVRDHKSKLVKALSHVKTSRRIILTGYPLQNHLEEYWTMVNFARPDYLGSLDEFKNRFVDPIENAQCVDSSEADLRLARQRAFVLTRELKPLVLRRDQQYLFRQLPPKKEWVLLCKLTDSQAQLYRQFLENGVPKRIAEVPGEGMKVVIDVLGGFHVALAISNHPDVLRETYRRLEEEARNPKKNPPKKRRNWTLKDDDDEDDYPFFAGVDPVPVATKNQAKSGDSTDDSELELLEALNSTATQAAKPDEPQGHRLSFAQTFMETYITRQLEASGKMMILMQILAACQEIGDRVIIFSQSIPTLDTIGDLITRHNRKQRSHSKRLNYLRIDGSTPQQERFRQIGQFNDLEEDVDVIMISTKAGGEGINLCGGNRIIIFDVCWNPCNDSQSMCRSYRFGQTKPVFVYRFVTAGTMEKKVYDLQIRKEGVAKRIVDEKTTERRFKSAELQNYFNMDDFEASLKHSQGQEEPSNPKAIPEDDIVLSRILSDMADTDGGDGSGGEASGGSRERCIIDWFEQETMFEEDLDQQCSPAEQKEIMESYTYLKAVRRLRKSGEYLMNREGMLFVQCQSCRLTIEIYPTSTTNVPVPTKIECGYCHQSTLTEGATAAPPAPAAAGMGGAYPFVGGVRLPFGAPMLHPLVAPGSTSLPGVSQPGSSLPLAIDVGRPAPAGVTAPPTARELPEHIARLLQRQTATGTAQEQQRTWNPEDLERQTRERERQQQVADEMRRRERLAMPLSERHMLVLRRGMEGCQKLKRSAEECGATIAIEVNSLLTDIVSAMSLEVTLDWLKLKRLPRDVDFHDATWLRDEIAKANGYTPAVDPSAAAKIQSSSSLGPSHTSILLSFGSPAESESVATDRSHEDSDQKAADSNSSGFIDLMDSDDEVAVGGPTQQVPVEVAEDSDDDIIEIL